MTNTIDLAIVIPTLNEEHYIGKLLDSIAKQTILPQEIVVVDACSQDKTMEEIKERQANLPQLKAYQIEKYSIGRQRNFGVSKTTSANLLFLDADMELREADILQTYLKNIEDKKADIAGADMAADSNYWQDKLFFWFFNLWFKLIKPVFPVASGGNLFVKRHFFEAVRGFDEEMAIGEDCEFVRRVIKKGGKLRLFSTPKVHTSVRRLEKEGRLRLNLKYSLWWIRVFLHGYKHNKVKYEFGTFKKPKP